MISAAASCFSTRLPATILGTTSSSFDPPFCLQNCFTSEILVRIDRLKSGSRVSLPFQQIPNRIPNQILSDMRSLMVHYCAGIAIAVVHRGLKGMR